MATSLKWNDYLDILARAGALQDVSWDPEDPQLRAEILQQITMNVMQGYLFYFASDPDYPDFIPFFNSALKLQPNPDDAYYLARVDARGVYRIFGERGTIHILNFTAAHDFAGTAESPGIQDGEIDACDMDIQDDGTFELIISGERPEGYSGRNWLKMGERTNYILVRMRSYAWGEERDPRLSIERLDVDPPQPRAGIEEIDERLRSVMVFAERVSRHWYEYQDQLRARGVVNEFELTRFEGYGGGNLQTYWQTIFKIEQKEALLLETEIPDNVRYWNVQLNDQLFNAIEFYYCQSSLNGHQARLDADGKFRAVIAREDPGVPNWLDPAGRLEGTIIGRWYGGDNAPLPSLKKIPLDAVWDHMPADTPRISEEARHEAIRARVRGGQRRKRW